MYVHIPSSTTSIVHVNSGVRKESRNYNSDTYARELRHQKGKQKMRVTRHAYMYMQESMFKRMKRMYTYVRLNIGLHISFSSGALTWVYRGPRVLTRE
jgi:hypothetical protein